MRIKLLIIAALAFGLTAGGALAKGGPPPGKEAAFQKQTKTLGYTCKPGTTHVEGTVVSVVPATATTPGTLTVLVTKGNSRGKSLVGQTITIGLLTSTQVIKTGHTTQAALAVDATVKLDLRLCTAGAPGSAPGLLARKVFSNK